MGLIRQASRNKMTGSGFHDGDRWRQNNSRWNASPRDPTRRRDFISANSTIHRVASPAGDFASTGEAATDLSPVHFALRRKVK